MSGGDTECLCSAQVEQLRAQAQSFSIDSQMSWTLVCIPVLEPGTLLQLRQTTAQRKEANWHPKP